MKTSFAFEQTTIFILDWKFLLFIVALQHELDSIEKDGIFETYFQLQNTYKSKTLYS